MSWDFFLAKKYLGHPAKRGIRLVLRLAVLGVALGVATLSLTQAVMNGFEKVFRESILGFNAHLVVLKDGEMQDPQAEEERIKKAISGEVLGATPFLYREVLLVAHGRVKGAVFKGIDPLTFARVYAVKTRRAGGAQVPAKIEELLNEDSELPNVVLGEDLAEELGLMGSNETLKVFLPKKEAGTNEKNFVSFRLAGTFRTGLYEFDRGFAFVSLPRMQVLLDSPGLASGVEMTLKKPLDAEPIAKGLRENLGRGYEAVSWQKLNGPLFSALKNERRMFLIIMAMVVVVASFNIVGVLLLMIFDRSREVSILRALGATKGGVQRLFGYQGLAIGALGSVLGIALAAALGVFAQRSGLLKLEKEVYLIERLPVAWSPSVVAATVGVSMLIALLATWVAVRRLGNNRLDL